MLRQRTFFALTSFPFGRSVWQAATVCVTAAMLAACGGSDDNTTGMVITPPLVVPPTTVAAAVAPTNTDAVVEPGGRVRARIETGDEQQYFRTPVSKTGTLTLRTEGVDTQIRAFDVDGNELPGIPGSLTVLITPEIVEQGAIVTEVTPAPASGPTGNTGVYTLSAMFTAGTGTTTPPTI